MGFAGGSIRHGPRGDAGHVRHPRRSYRAGALRRCAAHQQHHPRRSCSPRPARARWRSSPVNIDQARGYGRIVRNAEGRVTAIVEHKDATPEQLEIREVNSGLMAAPARTIARLAPGPRTQQRAARVFSDRCRRGRLQRGNSHRGYTCYECAGGRGSQRQTATERGRSWLSTTARGRAYVGRRDAR